MQNVLEYFNGVGVVVFVVVLKNVFCHSVISHSKSMQFLHYEQEKSDATYTKTII